MRKVPKLPEADKLLLHSLLNQVRAEWGFHRSIDLQWIVARWDQLVSEAERGYESSLEDFRFRLAMREILEFFLRNLTPKGQAVLEAWISKLDERFMFATHETEDSLYDTEWPTCQKLFQRLPNRIHGPLLEELKSEVESDK